METSVTSSGPKTFSDLASKTTLTRDQLIDRIKGCIFGGALGDAVGLAAEFVSKEGAATAYRKGPILFGTASGFPFIWDSHRSRWAPGDFTDDTDQQLLIALSLAENSGELRPRDFAARLLRWANHGFAELENKAPYGIGYTVGSVMSDQKFLKDPAQSAFDIWAHNGAELAANGAVMRTAILGIPFFWNDEKVQKNTIEACRITHADPRCIASCVMVTKMIAGMLKGTVPVPSTISVEKSTFVSKVAGWFSRSVIPNDVTKLIINEKPTDDTTSGSTSSSTIVTGVKVQDESSPESDSDDEEMLFPSSSILKLHLENPNRRVQRLNQFGHTYFTPLIYPLPKFVPSEDISAYSPPSVDGFGDDKAMLALATASYEQSTPLLNYYGFAQAFGDRFAEAEFKKHIFPARLKDLHLDEQKRIGYTYKCVGSGVFAGTRALDAALTPLEKKSMLGTGNSRNGELFKRILTEVILEGGDADTNGSVAGSLLGCRIGYSQLPKDWLAGLMHKDFLEARVAELVALVDN